MIKSKKIYDYAEIKHFENKALPRITWKNRQ